MASLRELKRRIKSVEGTKKMTRAMELVAAAKLQRLRALLADSDRYIADLARILATLVSEQSVTHPLLEKREEIKKTCAFLITSDTGLCGSYNTNVLDLANQAIKERPEGETIEFVSIGKNGAAYLKRRNQKIVTALPIPRPQDIEDTIHEITKLAVESFRSRKADKIVFLYTKVKSLAALKPQSERLFPITAKEDADTKSISTDYILEPDLTRVLDRLLPEYIEAEVGQFVKHSLVAEQASRMMAMRQASDNAKKMIDSLTLIRNKARQASITKELIEVVSGSLAQKK
jgi:F-type H+-transporting ATPase subunit gamma